MIYVEHDDVPYLVTDSEESLNFLRNTISMHCIDKDETVHHLAKTGVDCLELYELQSIEHILQIEGLVFTKFSSSIKMFIREIEDHYNVKIYKGEEDERN